MKNKACIISFADGISSLKTNEITIYNKTIKEKIATYNTQSAWKKEKINKNHSLKASDKRMERWRRKEKNAVQLLFSGKASDVTFDSL